MNFNKHELHSLLLHNLNYDLPVHLFEMIPSTNEQMWTILGEGSITPVAAIALQQSAGRGQWGRNWESPHGGLYLSLGLNLDFPLENNFHLTLLTALGIVKKLRQEEIPVLIKWPNDLILSGKKLGGIKTEIKTPNQQINQVVIGVGINWQNDVPATGINLSKYHLSLENLAAITITGILTEYQNYLAQGIDQLLVSYLKLLVNLGQIITFEGNTGSITGVNSSGDLIVKLSSPGATTEIHLPLGSISLGY